MDKNTVWLCEKPSQGRDIAAELGVVRKERTHIETQKGVVTWAFGHLVGFVDPDEYTPEWRFWDFAKLPMIPEKFRVKVSKDGAAQVNAIGRFLKTAKRVVIATDADREGEMIGRELLDFHGYSREIQRLWLRALDPESIRKALGDIRPGQSTRSLYDAAYARSAADWLVGMNMTRALTTRIGGKGNVLNVGRVQTPTFALVVRRDRAIADFKPKDYFALVATVEEAGTGQSIKLAYNPSEELRIYDKAEAEKLAGKARGQQTKLEVSKEQKRKAPPPLFALSGLQKKANAQWGWGADKTLKVAQALYEVHKATTYPRSDCAFLPEEQISDVSRIIEHLRPHFGDRWPVDFQPEIRKSVFNSKKITAHHAIIPTNAAAPVAKMSADERNLYMLIAASYVAALMPDYRFEQTVVRAACKGEKPRDPVIFEARGNVPQELGWRAMYQAAKDEGDEEENVLPPVTNGADAQVRAVMLDAKQTKPPAYYTEGTLIDDMKNIGKFVEDPAKKSRLKETSGIGTEATRASIIARLRDSGMLETKGKKIVSTPKSQALFDVLDRHLPALVDPGETAVWEEGLEEIVGGGKRDDFIAEISRMVAAMVDTLGRDVKAVPSSSGGPKFADTEEMSWHPDHADECVKEGDKSWLVPGYGFFPKQIAGRTLTLPEVRELTKNGKIGPLDGFVSKAKKPFSASLKWKKAGKDGKSSIDFDFGEPEAAPTGVKAGKRKIEDCGAFFTIEGQQGRIYKTICSRELRADEVAAIVEAGDKGVHLDGFVSKKGAAFSATVVWNPKKKPYPGMDLVFR